jgi:hypothetical protein
MRVQRSRSVQCASGEYFAIPPRRTSTSTSSVPARVGPCSRRRPVIHPSAPASARLSAATFATPQQCSGPVQGGVPNACMTWTFTPKRCSKTRQVSSVSAKSTPVSIVTTRTWGAIASSSSRITDSSF